MTGKVKKITFSNGKPELRFIYDALDRRIAKIAKTDNTTKKREITYYSYDASGNVMATYERTIQYVSGPNWSDNVYLETHELYGAERLGVENDYKRLASRTFATAVDPETMGAGTGITNYTYDQTQRLVGDKSYELANHLGNVLAIITDRKIRYTDNGTLVYAGDVISYTDYSPYGVKLGGRFGQTADQYTYGFQGQEEDDEIKGDGNSLNYEFRMHDPRIGRFFAIDPLAPKYPWYTPYQFSGNKVIHMVELEGLEEAPAGNMPVSQETQLNSVSYENNSIYSGSTSFSTTTTTEFNYDSREFIVNEKQTMTNVFYGKYSHTASTTTTTLSERTNTYSYEEVTGKKFNPWEIALEGYKNSDEYKNASTPEEKFARWETEGDLTGRMVGWGKIDPLNTSGATIDQTVIGFLPHYQIAKGIQEVQQGNNWGWLRIGLQVIPMPAVSKALSPIIRFEATLARGTLTLFNKLEATAMWNYRSGIGIGLRYNTNVGRMFGVELHTFGINAGRSAWVPSLHYHYAQAGIFSAGNHLPWNTPFKLGYSNSKQLLWYGFTGNGYKKTSMYQIMNQIKF